MLDVKDLKIGDEVKVINRVGNNVERSVWVKNGDIATVKSFYTECNVHKVELKCDSWNYPLFFLPHQIELYTEQPKTSQSGDLNMLDVKDLVEGVTKVRILTLPKRVEQEVGDVGIFQKNDGDDKLPLKVGFKHDYWYFDPEHLEIVESEDKPVKSTNQSEDLIIYKSRWDEIVESLEGWNVSVLLSNEEAEIVKSVLKNNLPFNIVNDPVIVDPIIEKGEQTHLDATHIGDTGNASLYYKSEILKKWFWWGEDYTWEECNFDYQDDEDLFPIAISK